MGFFDSGGSAGIGELYAGLETLQDAQNRALWTTQPYRHAGTAALTALESLIMGVPLYETTSYGALPLDTNNLVHPDQSDIPTTGIFGVLADPSMYGGTGEDGLLMEYRN
jgi:hypothetical protein